MRALSAARACFDRSARSAISESLRTLAIRRSARNAPYTPCSRSIASRRAATAAKRRNEASVRHTTTAAARRRASTFSRIASAAFVAARAASTTAHQPSHVRARSLLSHRATAPPASRSLLACTSRKAQRLSKHFASSRCDMCSTDTRTLPIVTRRSPQ
eukprot:88558-Pleurochrysis_carterae.AAC.3